MNRTSQRVLRTGFRHWLDTGKQALLPEGIPSVDLPNTASVSRPASGSRPEDAGSLLLAAKALVFCGFPYKRSPLTTVTREAQLGSDTHLTVYFSTTEPGIPIPFGADRALPAWITTLTYDTGFVNFTSLTAFFEAFHLVQTGVQYHRFEERLHRLLSLSLTLILQTPDGTARLNMRPMQRAYTPRDGAEARQLLAAESRSQLPLLPLDLQRYRNRSRPGFHRVPAQQPCGSTSPPDAEVPQPPALLGRRLLTCSTAAGRR